MTIDVGARPERLRRFHAFWDRLCAGAEPPPRARFDVIDMPRDLLPNLILLDVLDGGRDFRYRVVGTGVVDWIGHDFTGETITQYQHRHEHPDMGDGYRAVTRERRPHLCHGDLCSLGKEFVHYERLAAPLLGPARGVDTILACFEFNGTAPPP